MRNQPVQIIVDQKGNHLGKIDEIITGMASPNQHSNIGQQVSDRIKT